MRDRLKTFLIRLLFLYPLCLAGWWALAGIQIEGIASLASGMLRLFLTDVQVTLQTQWETITLTMRDRLGQTSIVIDPLVLTRGLPIYGALMLSAPRFRESWRGFLLGVLTIFITAAIGFSGEAATRMAETVSSHVQNPWVPAAFIQIIAKSVSTRVLPVGLWLWQQWAFITASIGASAITQTLLED